jgi:hypothetical protein
VNNVGPTQLQIDTAYTGTTLEGIVTSSGGIQSWTVPYTGTYRILVKGASGGTGDGGNTNPGKGAVMQGDVTLNEGTVLNIVVGQAGQNGGSSAAAGGGGGSFVWADLATNPLIVAGGGGGAGEEGSGTANNASITQYGISGGSTASELTATLGMGGHAGTDDYAGGGGARLGRKWY